MQKSNRIAIYLGLFFLLIAVVPTNAYVVIISPCPGGYCGPWTKPPDTTPYPDEFHFVDLSNVPRNRLIMSNTVTVTGLNRPAEIRLINGGEYRIGTGPWTTITGTIDNGQEVTLRQTSTTDYNCTTYITLNIGGSETRAAYGTSWRVATIPYVMCDINEDGLINLSDAIVVLQIVAGITPSQLVNKDARISIGDGIGLDEAIYILQKVAETR